MKKILLIMLGLSVGLMADFVRNDTDGIVADSVTGLEWQDVNIESVSYAWEAAITICEDMTLGAYSDWRMPNINELKSILDRSEANPAMSSVFTETVNVFWSSTSVIGQEDEAMIVTNDHGAVGNAAKTSSNRVRCVRTSN